MLDSLSLDARSAITGGDCAASTATDASRPQSVVILADGQSADLSGLTAEELYQLQWQQEVLFAEQIKSSPKGSSQRSDLISQAYATVCQILDQAERTQGLTADFAMGMDSRYTNMVLEVLRERRDAGQQSRLFEIGFGAGILLSAAANEGFEVGGFEVAPQLLERCRRRLPESQAGNLLLGSFLDLDLSQHRQQYGVVYWNDVFEHIPVDEIEDYLAAIHQLLVPGGQLITITPNWYMRPMDVTADHRPPRSEAIGFHLKEYTLGEVYRLLRSAGFQRIETPCFVGKRRIHRSRTGTGGTTLKIACEPWLERLPYRLAVQACRRLGLCCTIATKRSPPLR